MEIQLIFDEPLKVSTAFVKDQLNVTFMKPDFFYSPFDLAIIEQYYEIYHEIPPQEGHRFHLVLTTFSGIGTAMKVMFFGYLAMYFALGMKLQIFWNWVNSMQLMTHMALCNVELPRNGQVALFGLLNFSNFDWLPSEQINRWYWNFDDYPRAFLSRFDEVGYHSYNFILNLGTLYLLFVLGILSLLVVLILHYLSFYWPKINRAYTILYRYLCYNPIIRLCIEAYFPALLFSLANA